MNTTMRNGQRNDVVQIDLLALIKACWKQAWLIILVALLGGSLAYAGTKYFITPTYRTYFSAYVNNSVEAGSTTTITSSDLSASRSLADTAAGVIESATVLEQAAETVGLEEEDSVAVSTSVDSESGIITVYVVSTDPKMSASYAAAIAEVAAEETARIVEGSSMQIIDQPKIPTTIYSPSYTRNTAMGLLAGAFLVCAVVVLLELLNDRIQDQSELEERYGISVLGAIPDWTSVGKNQGYYYSREKAEV
ncbi:MAG: Wzz/FepE/Etk N-terminal domain-containing protein [Clostridiales bacterium]|nr:Wzz/FepE/Etk N-terminal domain-containing protein [Clostridiales bacterium]